MDRLGLDIALELGIPIGGWCPAGRRAQDGRVPDKYPLKETTSFSYQTRTRMNIQEADATMLVYFSLPLSPGSALTARLCRQLGKPLMEVYLPDRSGPLEPRVALSEAFKRMQRQDLKVLNVAGPRAIPDDRLPFAYETIRRLLKEWREA